MQQSDSIYDSDDHSEYDPARDNPESGSSSEEEHPTVRRVVNPAPLVAAAEGNLADALPVPPGSTRKRKRQSGEWKKVKKSAAYNTGLTRTQKGEQRQRRVGPRCACKQRQCSTVSENARKLVHDAYWKLGKAILRQNFIVGHCTQTAKARAKPESTRGDPIRYYFTVEDGTRVQVCENNFLSTLDISKSSIHYNLKKSTNGARQITIRPSPANKIPSEAADSVKAHISSINTIESHYCRATTKRKYFEAGLSVPKLYQMYKTSDHFHPIIKQSYYNKVFTEDFNIGFHVPTKDRCDTCTTYEKTKELSQDENSNVPAVLIETLEEKQISHIRRKKSAQETKEMDKQRTDGLRTITFDLQQVLTAPRLFNGAAYYKRKLNCYNLTVYELQTKRGFCYTWHEGEASRGTNEISSCLVKYLNRIDSEGGVTKVIMYSDTCGGQNRNKIFCTSMIHFLTTSTNINTIEHKYFESGHSHMECDSMHSAIERSFKNKEVDLPCGYIQHMISARSNNPYTVAEMTHEDILDFKMLNDRSMKSDAFSGIINTHYINYKKVSETGRDPAVEMSNEIGGEVRQISYRKRGGKHALNAVPQAYSESIPLNKEKKADILALLPFCTSRQMATLFYNSLKCDD